METLLFFVLYFSCFVKVSSILSPSLSKSVFGIIMYGDMFYKIKKTLRHVETHSHYYNIRGNGPVMNASLSASAFRWRSGTKANNISTIVVTLIILFSSFYVRKYFLYTEEESVF